MTSVIGKETIGEQETAPDVQSHGIIDFMRHRLTRRLATVAISTMAIMATDSFAGGLIWTDNDTRVEAYAPMTMPDSQDLVLAGSGLGMRSAKYISKSLASIDVNSAYVQWPDHDASVEKMTKAAAPYIRDAESVSIVAASMGAPMMLEMMLESAREGANRPLKDVVLISSPFDIDDARFANGAKALDSLHDKGYQGGPLGHILYRATVDWYRGRLADRSPLQEWEIIQYEINHGNPISLTMDQIDISNNLEFQSEADAFKSYNLINANTRFYYYRTANAADDRVVDVDSAQAKWQAFADNFGAKLEVIYIPGMEHADVQAVIPMLTNGILPNR